MTGEVLGVGFGPANIALAIAAEASGELQEFSFIESAEDAGWQRGMLLPESDTQHHPVRDLVSLRDPRSRYSFLNFLHEHDRLLDFLNLPLEFALRTDYAEYVSWAGKTVPADVTYGVRANRVRRDHDEFVVDTSVGKRRAERVVIGTGRSPYVPDVLKGLAKDQLVHSSGYLSIFSDSFPGEAPTSVLIVGASQSAVEIALDLASRSGIAVTLISRGLGPRLKDVSPFTEHAYFPEFTDYYFGLPHEAKRSMDRSLRHSNYSAVDGDVLKDLYVKLYERKVSGNSDLRLIPLARLQDARGVEHGVEVVFTTTDEGERTERFDLVIAATGYRDIGPGPTQESVPPLLRDLQGDLLFDRHGYLHVNRDYELSWVDGSRAGIYLNGLCESSHGLGDAGSFSLLSLRTELIRESLSSRVEGVTGMGRKAS